MFAEDFQEEYLRTGINGFDENNDVTRKQFIRDIHALFGAIQCSIKTGIGLKEIVTHSATQDGLKVWIALVKQYDQGGSKDIKIARMESIVSTPFFKNYKGGLTQWVTDYQAAFGELTFTLKVPGGDDDQVLKRRMLQNMRQTHMPWLVVAARNQTFGEMCQNIYEHAMQEDNGNTERAARKACQATIEGISDENKTYTNMEFIAALSRVDNEVWKRLPEDVKTNTGEEKRGMACITKAQSIIILD